MKFKIEFEEEGSKTTIEGEALTWREIADRFHDALLGASYQLTREDLSDHFASDDHIGGIDYDNLWVDECGGYADSDINFDVGDITITIDKDHDVA
jgi:hypothetical protein